MSQEATTACLDRKVKGYGYLINVGVSQLLRAVGQTVRGRANSWEFCQSTLILIHVGRVLCRAGNILRTTW